MQAQCALEQQLQQIHMREMQLQAVEDKMAADQEAELRRQREAAEQVLRK